MKLSHLHLQASQRTPAPAVKRNAAIINVISHTCVRESNIFLYKGMQRVVLGEEILTRGERSSLTDLLFTTEWSE